jgi:protein SCO1/2
MNSRPCNEQPLLPTAVAVAACTLVGVLALYYGTAGFRALSTETGRRLAIAERPAALPDTLVRRALDGRTLSLAAELAGDNRVAIVTFVYTRCQSVCSVAGTELQQMQRRLREGRLAGRVRLVTISFDPADDRQALARYARRMEADPALWQFYGVDDPAALRRLLDTFGIVVVPAPNGEFIHNAVFHVVDRGRLRGIVDLGEPAAVIAAALREGS